MEYRRLRISMSKSVLSNLHRGPHPVVNGKRVISLLQTVLGLRR